jgi:hypothetical protein
MQQMGEALKVVKQQNSLLKVCNLISSCTVSNSCNHAQETKGSGFLRQVQLEAARQQLIEWQEVADFQACDDGSWKSGRVQALQRQVGAP